MALQWLAWGSVAMAGQLRPFKVPIALDHSVELVVAGAAIVTAINFASAAAW
jgi:3-keto-L-gulonate-6-phosphate decarboxylase